VAAVVGDRLTVQLDRVPLSLVLAEVARQAGLRVSRSEAVAGVLVSASFRGLPLDEGLERLLRAQPHVLAYDPVPATPESPASWRVSEILVFAMAQPPAADQPAGDSAVPVLADPDPQVRIQALEAWVQQRQGDSVDTLTYALVDPEEQVRVRAQELWERLLATPPPASPLPSSPGGG
jgi:hypothetical protein